MGTASQGDDRGAREGRAGGRLGAVESGKASGRTARRRPTPATGGSAANHETAKSAGPAYPSLVERVWLGGLLALAAFLLLYNLGAPRMWQDEAETALLGRNTLRFGVPRVWDGRNLVAQYYANDLDEHLLFQKSWLPSYLVAGSFALLGEGTAAARLPFALCGLLSVWLTWRLGRRLTGDRTTALLSAAFLVLCLPFPLYCRQCRWYGLGMMLTLLLVEAEERLDERRGWLLFGIVLGALFHANYLVFFATLPGLLLGRLATRGLRSLDRPMLAGFALGAAVITPFLAFFPPFGSAVGAEGLGSFLYSASWVTGDLNRYILPLPGLALLVGLRRSPLLSAAWFRRLGIVLLVAVPLVSLTLWEGLVDIIGFRYVINLLPVAALLLAAVLRAASAGRPALLAGLVALHLLTYALAFPISMWPPKGRPNLVRSDLLDGVKSVVRPVRGPIDAAVEFLEKRAKPEEMIFTPYEQLPFQFYTRLRTVGLQKSEQNLQRLRIDLPKYVSTIPPGLDWYLPRVRWKNFLGAPSTQELIAFLGQHGTRKGERFVLDAPDLAWQTREYPPCRSFDPPADVPRVELFHFPKTRDSSVTAPPAGEGRGDGK